MKKLFFTALVLFTMYPSAHVSAQSNLPFPHEEVLWNIIVFQLYTPDIRPDTGYSRSPVNPPQIEQSGYLLHFSNGADLLLNIIYKEDDGEETIEYTVPVCAETEVLQLPATLSGTYTIEVVRGSQCFRSEIAL